MLSLRFSATYCRFIGHNRTTGVRTPQIYGLVSLEPRSTPVSSLSASTTGRHPGPRGRQPPATPPPSPQCPHRSSKTEGCLLTCQEIPCLSRRSFSESTLNADPREVPAIWAPPPASMDSASTKITLWDFVGWMLPVSSVETSRQQPKLRFL
jgi:hypothetical protein